MFNNKGRRRKFHSNSNRPFRRRHNGDGHRNKSPNSIVHGQFRNNSFKGIHNTEKLVEKYNLLAKEALTSGDRTLSENYYQHADHFMRIVYEKNLAQKQNNSQINESKVIADEKNLTNKSKEEEKK